MMRGMRVYTVHAPPDALDAPERFLRAALTED